jgi:hypothetical protein
VQKGDPPPSSPSVDTTVPAVEVSMSKRILAVWSGVSFAARRHRAVEIVDVAVGVDFTADGVVCFAFVVGVEVDVV